MLYIEHYVTKKERFEVEISEGTSLVCNVYCGETIRDVPVISKKSASVFFLRYLCLCFKHLTPKKSKKFTIFIHLSQKSSFFPVDLQEVVRGWFGYSEAAYT